MEYHNGLVLKANLLAAERINRLNYLSIKCY